MSNTTKKNTTTKIIPTTTPEPATQTGSAGGQASRQETGTLSLRVNDTNVNHHLWNNNGTWWLHYTLHLPDFTKKRVRKSLHTSSLERARKLRDCLLEKDGTVSVSNCEQVVPPDGLSA
ncbi:MAG: hypothetical protein SGI98_07070 [Verrucomicrobiota bacterium]|nr:hypothetical protein [Verrucomicrobiota bacterium]